MSIEIASIENHSPCRPKVQVGERLAAINGTAITDVLDYMHFSTLANPTLTIEDKGGQSRQVAIKKPAYGDLGLEFSTFLMDRQRGCCNKCVFCFIDQLPENMRETLYFKDDDARMSFLMGNYISLTNLSERDVERMISYKISPINVSVHTMNPELRAKMLGNPRGGEALGILRRFVEAGLRINCQIVVCKGLNDGEELSRTVEELLAMDAESIAVVPSGLTSHREGLYPLPPLSKEDAADACRRVMALGDTSIAVRGQRKVFLADEFFIKAGMEIPPYEYYEDFSQLENGVGLIAMLQDEVSFALEDAQNPKVRRRYTAVTGVSVYPFIRKILDALQEKCPHVTVDLVPVPNDFFGESIDVTGLVTGVDIVKNLEGRDLGERLIIPAAMLRYDRERFLDDITVAELEARLQISTLILENDGAVLVETLTREK